MAKGENGKWSRPVGVCRGHRVVGADEAQLELADVDILVAAASAGEAEQKAFEERVVGDGKLNGLGHGKRRQRQGLVIVAQSGVPKESGGDIRTA